MGEHVVTPTPAIAASIAASAVLTFSRQEGRAPLVGSPRGLKIHVIPETRAVNVTHMWSARSAGVFGTPWAAK
jgi:hypothetical protein